MDRRGAIPQLRWLHQFRGIVAALHDDGERCRERVLMIDAAALTGIVVAALGGAAIGVERQRSVDAEAAPRLGGVRTFTLIGGSAGIAGWLTTLHAAGVAAILV